MLKITPFLTFNGQCNRAIKLYEQAFGATLKFKMLFSEANPKDFQVKNEAEKDFIYHAQIMIDEQLIYLCDDSENSLGTGTTSKQTEIDLCVTFDTIDKAKVAYEIMKENATILVPISNATYTSFYVHLIDKFGVRWMLMTD